jgi:hypothetical protein
MALFSKHPVCERFRYQVEKDETKRDRYALAINGLHIVTCAERGSRPTAAQRLHMALTSEQALMMPLWSPSLMTGCSGLTVLNTLTYLRGVSRAHV